MSNTVTQTYQNGVLNLQAWLDFLSVEEEKLETQLAKMQGGSAVLPGIDVDTPDMAKDEPLPNPDSNLEEIDKWA